KALKAAEQNPKSAGELQGWVLENFAGLPATEKVVGLLRGLSDKGSSDTIRGRSTFALAEALTKRSERGDDPKKAAADAKEAEALYERVVKEYAKVTDDGEPRGDAAKLRLHEVRNLAVGKPAPAAESKDLDGKAAKLADHKGKVVVLDFWAT